MLDFSNSVWFLILSRTFSCDVSTVYLTVNSNKGKHIRYMYYTYGTCITHMVHVLHIWYMYYTYGICITHMVHVLHIWYMYYTYGTCITHTVWFRQVLLYSYHLEDIIECMLKRLFIMMCWSRRHH